MKIQSILFSGVLLFLIACTQVSAQVKDGSFSYTYSEVQIRYNALGKHKSTQLNFGDEYPIEVNQKKELQDKVATFKNEIDVMNYLSDNQWECFDSQIILSTSVTFYIFYFRKPKNK